MGGQQTLGLPLHGLAQQTAVCEGFRTVGYHNMASEVSVTHGTEDLGSGTGLGGRGGALIPVSTGLENIGRLWSLGGREAASDGAAGLYFSDDL